MTEPDPMFQTRHLAANAAVACTMCGSLVAAEDREKHHYWHSVIASLVKALEPIISPEAWR